jgi:hypothetical protein
VAWVLWGLSLLACPVTMIVLGAVYYQAPSPENFLKPLPWTWHVVEVLFWCHAGISVVAAAGVFGLLEGWQSRWRAWQVVLVLLGLTWVASFAASMAVSGRYL